MTSNEGKTIQIGELSKFSHGQMGVALLGFAQSKKNVSNRKSLIHTFGKVCAKFRGYLKICRHISINDWTNIVLVLEKPIHAIKSIRSSRIGSFISFDDERLSKFSPIK